jgi:hypothetical protein
MVSFLYSSGGLQDNRRWRRYEVKSAAMTVRGSEVNSPILPFMTERKIPFPVQVRLKMALQRVRGPSSAVIRFGFLASLLICVLSNVI